MNGSRQIISHSGVVEHYPVTLGLHVVLVGNRKGYSSLIRIANSEMNLLRGGGILQKAIDDPQ